MQDSRSDSVAAQNLGTVESDNAERVTASIDSPPCQTGTSDALASSAAPTFVKAQDLIRASTSGVMSGTALEPHGAAMRLHHVDPITPEVARFFNEALQWRFSGGN